MSISKPTVLGLACTKLAVHLYAGQYYGFFRDELYYIACGKHLAWGYVDQPPLIALIAWLVRVVLGDSLTAIRVLPALAGAGEVALASLITAEMGGGTFAQLMAGLTTLTALGILSVDNFFSMNAFEPLFWLGCSWLLIRMVKSGNTRLWIWFGILAGIGLENKYSTLIFGAGIVVGLLLTPQRKLLWSRWLVAGGTIAFLLFLPNILWNVQHHFPFLELQRNIRASGRDVALGPGGFFAQETLVMHPLALPVWLAGLWFFFASVTGRRFRFLGWTWVFVAIVVLSMSPRIYYLFPAYPLLFVGGALAWETWLARVSWLRYAYPILLVMSAAVLAPLAIPVIPADKYVAYTNAIHLGQPAIENQRLGPLPQIFADEFGWQEMATEVARVYNSLPADARPDTAIIAQNYGEAGAVDFFGSRLGLPPALSGHQNYFLWGPRSYTGESVIVIGDRKRRLEQLFTSVELAGHTEHLYSMPYEHVDVFYCRGLRGSLADLWPHIKNWD